MTLAPIVARIFRTSACAQTAECRRRPEQGAIVRSTPETARDSKDSHDLLLGDERELDADRDLVGQGACAVWQGCVPADAVVAPVYRRLEREVRAGLPGGVRRGWTPRAVRDDRTRESPGVTGLYPIGEGAGYAGGIVSAAVDGLRSALAIIGKYAPCG